MKEMTNLEKVRALRSLTTDVKNVIEEVTQKKVRVVGARRWEVNDEMVRKNE